MARRYEQRERARKHEETRQRIVEAVIELHETVGAAQTRVVEVARRAGVGRMTVYNHFPTEADMVTACTSHWIELHPPPDVEAWRRIADPGERLDYALTELYAYYRDTQAMWTTAYRDARLVESLGQIMDATWFATLARALEVLAAGRGLRGARRRRLVGALRLAVDFPTWRTLTDSGLGDAEAAGVAAAFVSSSAAG
ncbi:MAG TPA: TetR/AcrR family transcriptional regulator [Solirubrobacteraceae bacterium]|nr:TetR/AcrR family transcriptional regulator [Solirubrobacteraceae bacterium]